MLQNVEAEETPLQRRLDQLGKSLSVGSLFLVAFVFIVALINQTSVGELFTGPLVYLKEYATEITDVFIIAISLAIAAVPEGLPAVVTISLALGMREMIKRLALIRKLSSVETLGSATVICSDKTGTLTQNEMTVTRIWADGQFVSVSGTGYTPKGEFHVNGKPVETKKYPAILSTLWLGVLNNDSLIETTGESETNMTYRIVGDPTEGALLVVAAKAGAVHLDVKEAYPRENEVPFDTERKRMITIHEVNRPHRNDLSPFYNDENKNWNVIAMDDTIKLDKKVFSVFTNSLPSPIGPGQFVTGTQALDTNDFIIYNKTTGAVFYDADGNGAGEAVQFVGVTPGLSLTNADFHVI